MTEKYWDMRFFTKQKNTMGAEATDVVQQP